MLKLNSKNLFNVSTEDHTTESAEELNEQGAISHADAEEAEAPVVPEADVTEAGDDVGQATPKEEITPDYKSDITSTDVADDATPLEGAADSEDAGEVNELIQEGEQAAAAKNEIVEQAVSEATGGDAGESDNTDVNGNPITEAQAAENKEEDATEDEVEDEVEEEAAAKNIHQEAEEVDENTDEALGDAINDPTEGGDTGGDDFGGDATDGELGTDGLDDDTPLEGADDLESGGDDGAVDTGADSADAGDLGDSESGETDLGGTDESEPAVDAGEEGGEEPLGTDDVGADDTGTEPPADGGGDVGADPTVVEAEVPDNVDTDVGTTDTSGDVETTGSEEPATDEDDDTPLEGAEELDVDVDDSIVQPDGDNGGEDGSAATVEESITEGTSEDLQDGVDDVATAAAEVEEDGGESTDGVVDDETPLAEGAADGAIGADTGDETGEGTAESDAEVIDEAPPADADVTDTDAEVESEVADAEASEGPDTEAGEVEETEEEADFDEGEVDVKDVDMDTTDEDVEEAMDKAAEVGEWGDKEEKDGELADKTIEELQKEKESLETFRCILEDSIAKESFNPGLLAYMNHQAEPIRRKLSKLDAHFDTKTPAKVALEDYTGKDMDLAYRATLESFQGMISRLMTLTTGIAHKIENWWSRSLVDKVLTRADALDKQIDLCLIQLKDSSFSTGEITGVRGYLATNETNLPKAVAADLATVGDIAIKGIKSSEQLQTTVVKALNDIISAGSEQEISKVLDSLAALKSTKTSFPGAAFDKGLLGGYRLEIRDESGSDRSEKIEAMGHNGIPVGVKSGKAGDNTTYTLSKGDVVNLLKMAKTYVGIARKLANTTGDRAISLGTKVRTTRNRALPVLADTRVRGDEHGVDAAATAMKLLAKAHVDLYKFITKHCVEVADALCGVAKKATK